MASFQSLSVKTCWNLSRVIPAKSKPYCRSKWSKDVVVTAHKRYLSLEIHPRVHHRLHPCHRLTPGRSITTFSRYNSNGNPAITMSSLLAGGSRRLCHSMNSTATVVRPSQCRPISTTGVLFPDGIHDIPPNSNNSSSTNYLQKTAPIINLNGWWDELRRYVVLTSLGLAIALIPLGLLWLKYNSWLKVHNVDNTLLNGSSIPEDVDGFPVNKQNIKAISNHFMAEKGTSNFGIILAPSGTGKKHIVREACRKHPQGVVYCDLMTVGDHQAAECLAKASGMRTKPTLLGALAEYRFGLLPIGYYKLPAHNALAYVVKEIAMRSEELFKKKRSDRPVCLLIDGVDAIAKNDKELFKQLVHLAEANKKFLHMVFVTSSSKNCMHSLLQSPSLQSQSWDVMKLVDITKDQAIDFLDKKGLPNELAKQIIDVTGPRLSFCRFAVKLYKKQEITDFKYIMKSYHQRFVSSAVYTFMAGKAATKRIIQELIKCEEAGTEFYLNAFLDNCNDKKDRVELKEAINDLVQAQALILTTGRSENLILQWDNKLVRAAILEKFN